VEDGDGAGFLLDLGVSGDCVGIGVYNFADGGEGSRFDDHFDDILLSGYVHDA